MNLPQEFICRTKTLLNDYGEFEKSYENDFHFGIRINTLKTDKNYIFSKINSLGENVKWCENGFYSMDKSLSKNILYSAGLYYIQEPSAMLPASILPVEKGDFVLDLCAAPGGKSTLLGEKLADTGLLVANDLSFSRCAALAKNIEKHGIKNACILSEESGKLANFFSEFFDKILIDAPCSGEGMFRKDNKAVSSWCEKGPSYYTPIQSKLLEDAALMLKPGGIIAYSTCTFNRFENEDIISAFLEKHKDFQPVKINCEKYGISKGFLEGCGRIWPHRQKGEGHFISLIIKAGEKELDYQFDNFLDFSLISKNEEKEIRDFLTKFEHKLNGKIIKHKDTFMLAPHFLYDTKGLRTMRSGLSLGSFAKQGFEPSQALAMVLNNQNDNSVNLDEMHSLKYLKGESLDIKLSDGFVLVKYDGYPLGWAKSSAGRLKNKYAKNWI